jgi:hypothetical protein
MKNTDKAPQVFISHSSLDTWISKQIGIHIEKCGAKYFLDESGIEHGDDFDIVICKAANNSSELVVLFTPWSITRPYIWVEIGIFFGANKRIVGILHGLTVEDILTDPKVPTLLKKKDLVYLNDIDSYFAQLEKRVTAGNEKNG